MAVDKIKRFFVTIFFLVFLTLCTPHFHTLFSVLAAGRSRVTMDHYDFPTGNAACSVELGRPGKGSVPVPGVRANGLFTVVQQT